MLGTVAFETATNVLAPFILERRAPELVWLGRETEVGTGSPPRSPSPPVIRAHEPA